MSETPLAICQGKNGFPQAMKNK